MENKDSRYAKTGAVLTIDRKIIEHTAVVNLRTVKALEDKLRKEGKLNVYFVKGLRIESSFTEDKSPMVDCVLNPPQLISNSSLTVKNNGKQK